jgi:hypothetical protein
MYIITKNLYVHIYDNIYNYIYLHIGGLVQLSYRVNTNSSISSEADIENNLRNMVHLDLHYFYIQQ